MVVALLILSEEQAVHFRSSRPGCLIPGRRQGSGVALLNAIRLPDEMY